MIKIYNKKNVYLALSNFLNLQCNNFERGLNAEISKYGDCI